MKTAIPCPNCHRKVTEVNYHEDLGTCLFCHLNREASHVPE